MKRMKKWWRGGEQGGGGGEEEEEEEEKEEEEKEEDEEEEEITTAMHFSTAIQQSCTRGPRQLFLSSEQGVRGRRWRRRRRSQLQCSLL